MCYISGFSMAPCLRETNFIARLSEKRAVATLAFKNFLHFGSAADIP